MFERVYNIPFSSLNATGTSCRRNDLGSEGCRESTLNSNNAHIFISSNMPKNRTIVLSCVEPPIVERSWVDTNENDQQQEVADCQASKCPIM